MKKNIKKKLAMITSTVLTICIVAATAVIPAFADSGINSRGEIVLEDSNVEFDSADIESLKTQVDMLSEGISEEAYVSENKGILKEGLNSKGIINYDSGKVVFDSSDLVKLADGIDNLDTGYKYEAVSALNKINTFIKADGAVVHDKTNETIQPEAASKLTIAQICEGILKSQSVDHLTDQNIVPASENSLSEGCAAWVDGRLIIGNGGDNKANYDKGYEEGESSQPAAGGYYLGNEMKNSYSGRRYIDVAENAPADIDYTKLTTNNFIVCPCEILGKTAKGTKYLSTASDVVSYCTINNAELKPVAEYSAADGRLYIDHIYITAKGGLSPSGYNHKVETYMEFCAYLIVGGVVTP